VARLLETRAAESRVEDFGFPRRAASNLGPFSLVAREETTARRALETFSSLVDDVRGELAEDYFEGNKGRLTDLANLLWLSAFSAFSRWHRRHFGFTLTERRSGK
jgi:AraC-like DNA-binding protein